MKIGAIYPQIEFGTDVAKIREYATTVEALGYDHIVAYDHVVGAGRTSRPDWQGPYHAGHVFHEPFVLFSYLAAITTRVGFFSGIIILPQRQTVLVAKQAACLDLLSGGRFRMGIGTGWNEVEYEALGENFHDRGRRSEEQIALMRALWKDTAITFDGRWHKVIDAGINPLPVRREIPIWLGGMAPAVIERVGRIADGWVPLARPGVDIKPLIARMHEHARAAGRDPARIGIQIGIAADDSVSRNAERIERAAAWGATHVSVNTMGLGFTTPDEHIDRIKLFAEAMEQVG